MNKRLLSLLALAQLVILLVSCEVPSEIDKNAVSNREPVCKIIEPANGSIVHTTDIVNVKAVIYDIDGKIESYKFTVNGNEVPASLIKPVPDNDTTFYYSGTMLNLPPDANNKYIIKAFAKDEAGKEKNSEVVLDVENYTPICSILNPIANSVVNVGQTVPVNVLAKDKDGNIDSLALYVDGVWRASQVGHANNDSLYSFDYSVTAILSNSHTLQVKAYDNKHANQSANSVVKVNNLPSCTITAPTANSFYASESAEYIRISFMIADKDTVSGDNITSLEYRVNGTYVTKSTGIKSGVTYTMPLASSYFVSGMKNKIKITAYDKFNGVSSDSLIVNCVSQSKVAFYDGFESYADFDISSNLIPSNNPTITNWTQQDFDKGTTYTINGYTYPNKGYIGSYMMFNPSQAFDKDNKPLNLQAHDGKKFAACFSNLQNSGASQNNDWLVTKKITVPSTFVQPKVTFWARSYTTQYGSEKFGVYASNTGYNLGNGMEQVTSSGVPSVGDFKKKLSSNGAAYAWEDAPKDWGSFTYDLSPLLSASNRDIYITIACKSTDVFFLLLDDFMVFDAAMPAYAPQNIKRPSQMNTQIKEAYRTSAKPAARRAKK